MRCARRCGDAVEEARSSAESVTPRASSAHSRKWWISQSSRSSSKARDGDDAAVRELRERPLRLGEVADRADVELLFARRVGAPGRRRACRRRGLRGGPSRAPCLRRGRAGTSTPRAARRSRTSRNGQRAAAAPLADLLGLGPVGHEHADPGRRRRRARDSSAAWRRRPASAPRRARRTDGRQARATSASSASEVGLGGSAASRKRRRRLERTWQWGSRRRGPRGTTASR